MSQAARLPDAVIDAAILWSVKLQYNQASPEALLDFERWRQADAAHAQAWERVTGLARPFDAVPGAWVQSALASAKTLSEQRQTRRRQILRVALLGGVALGATWLGRDQLPWQGMWADASTGVGEQRQWHLQDGTLLVLNTESAVSIHLTDTRLLDLHHGEISVTTGKDAEAAAYRPFWVQTPFGRMQALGTQFTVRLSSAGAQVAVQEGAVALHPAEGGEVHIVAPGQARLLQRTGSIEADLHGLSADAWAQGVIVGENMRLADLLDELARYRRGVIRCDAAVADLKVSGLFHVRDTDRALRFLAQTQPVRVRSLSRFWISVEAL